MIPKNAVHLQQGKQAPTLLDIYPSFNFYVIINII